MKIIQDTENTILFSQVSLFEISIKQKIGKLPALYASIDEIYQQGLRDGFTFINIQNRHIYSYDKIPLVKDHRDPFDRLLLATALEESTTFISADEQLFLYAEVIDILWLA